MLRSPDTMLHSTSATGVVIVKTLVALLAGIAVASSASADVHRYGPPPKPYVEKVVLPGKTPPNANSVGGAWYYAYVLADAPLEAGTQDQFFSTVLTLRKDGTYELRYQARWNLPRATSPVQILPSLPVPFPTSSPKTDGINVTEIGRYVSSGEILLLEATQTRRAKVNANRIENEEKIPNEKHVRVVRLEPKRLAMAGRCATWQIDPVCTTTPNNWYVMNSSPTQP